MSGARPQSPRSRRRSGRMQSIADPLRVDGVRPCAGPRKVPPRADTCPSRAAADLVNCPALSVQNTRKSLSMMTGAKFRRLATSVLKAGPSAARALRSRPFWTLLILRITSPIQPGMPGRALSNYFISASPTRAASRKMTSASTCLQPMMIPSAIAGTGDTPFLSENAAVISNTTDTVCCGDVTVSILSIASSMKASRRCANG